MLVQHLSHRKPEEEGASPARWTLSSLSRLHLCCERGDPVVNPNHSLAPTTLEQPVIISALITIIHTSSSCVPQISWLLGPSCKKKIKEKKRKEPECIENPVQPTEVMAHLQGRLTSVRMRHQKLTVRPALGSLMFHMNFLQTLSHLSRVKNT